LKKLYHNFAEMGLVIKDKTDGVNRTISITKEINSDPDNKTFSISADTPRNSGSAVSAVSAVMSHDIKTISLTADDKTAVSGVSVSDDFAPLSGKNETENLEMPEEVMGWPAHVQEIFKITTEVNMEMGMSREEAILDAMDHVRSAHVDHAESK
jgi:hypothetical protein